jgi:hypothetical protein
MPTTTADEAGLRAVRQTKLSGDGTAVLGADMSTIRVGERQILRPDAKNFTST